MRNINELCDVVRQTGYEIHAYLAHGHLEKVYENALLHRLKKLDLIRQPSGATGMYEITNAGLGHARTLRSSFGAYLPA